MGLVSTFCVARRSLESLNSLLQPGSGKRLLTNIAHEFGERANRSRSLSRVLSISDNSRAIQQSTKRDVAKHSYRDSPENETTAFWTQKENPDSEGEPKRSEMPLKQKAPGSSGLLRSHWSLSGGALPVRNGIGKRSAPKNPEDQAAPWETAARVWVTMATSTSPSIFTVTPLGRLRSETLRA